METGESASLSFIPSFQNHLILKRLDEMSNLSGCSILSLIPYTGGRIEYDKVWINFSRKTTFDFPIYFNAIKRLKRTELRISN